ncbi:hypothetical protein Y1Q_0003302 [Alligator mississippiensis]|uniref:Uncharacterized protein n=1 Tax=Alligator mississippiensis TaxID=8496 RepID=A0A151ME70_ALLMI|nr:hypothetical protein Y1Q_0003302 [Alligator mississippiensis]
MLYVPDVRSRAANRVAGRGPCAWGGVVVLRRGSPTRPLRRRGLEAAVQRLLGVSALSRIMNHGKIST